MNPWRTFLACLVLTGCALAQDSVVQVWNGVVNPKALFYGYVALAGGRPLARGTTLWVPGPKGMTSWTMQDVSPQDATMTLYADFDVDPNLVEDMKNNPDKLLIPIWKTSIHCELTVPNSPTSFGILFVENPTGKPSKYACVIQE